MSVQASGPQVAAALRFRTGAAILTRLGSEQLRDEITALMELVKNAYDADATLVVLELRDTEEGQRLLIQDNGSGMTLEDLNSNWAFLATENKLRADRSPVFQRRRLGQKGVGRFAAEKLGKQLILRTRPLGQDFVLQVKFNWDEFSADRELGDYSFPISHKRPEPYEPQQGTRLDIRSLRVRWTKARTEKLRAQLATLIDPESGSADFKIHLVTPWRDLNGQLENPLPGNETHRIEFEISESGLERLKRYAQGKESVLEKQIEPPLFGPIRGRLRYFGQGLKMAERGRGGATDLDWNMGVRMFRDGCRVRPYGEPGPEGDWLQIYRARYLRGSRFRLKPHYLEGTIHISKDRNPRLRDTTSREGLMADEHVSAFVEYVRDKVAEVSELVREEEQKEERSRMQERYKKALAPLSEGLNDVRSEEYRRAVEDWDKQVRKSLTKPAPPPEIRNAHWECLDCSDAWKVPRDLIPSRCREFSVGRDGKPTQKPGCGSTNIKRKENIPRNNPALPNTGELLADVMGGLPAYPGGIQLTPTFDWEMGENDDEAEVRPDRRELAINGRHPAFRAADQLDGRETAEGADFESLRAVAGLTIHVINAASLAWGSWHYRKSGGQFEQFLSNYAALKQACLARLAPALPEGTAH